MVLHPFDSVPPGEGFVAAWEAVARAQKHTSHKSYLIAQPDHADLAGDLAERVESELFPTVDSAVVEAIRLHDEGWTEFDREVTMRGNRPLSFLDFGPADFLKAWRGSIARAEQSSAIGGLLVSSHFRRLGAFRMQTAQDSEEDKKLVSEFLREEDERESRLLAQQNQSGDEIRLLVDVLQFCDLLSLYLCCGSREKVEFPQNFQGKVIRAAYQDGLCRTEPALFTTGTSLGVRARKYPGTQESTTIPFLLA